MDDFKCPECGAPKSKIRYVQTCVEYHYIDEVYEDGDVDLGGIDDSYPEDNYWFDCQSCTHTWGPGAPEVPSFVLPCKTDERGNCTVHPGECPDGPKIPNCS